MENRQSLIPVNYQPAPAPAPARAASNGMVAALYVEAGGSYYDLPNVDPWDERRDARSRLAHFLCEFAIRLDMQGLTGAEGYELPMSQEQLGDALGLTAVHVNRTIKSLEADGLIGRNRRRISFPQWDALRELADFSSRYLHLAQQVN